MTPSRWVSRRQQSSSTDGFFQEIPRLAAVAIAYFIAARVGLLFIMQPEGIGSIWPPSGVALAALILIERRKWPLLLLVIFATNTAGNLTGGNSLLVSLGFALANIVEAAAGGWVIVHFCGPKITFARVKEVIVLCGVATLSNGITAFLGAAVAALALGAPFFDTWFVWWVSDALGMILVTPVIVTWATSPNVLQALTSRRFVEEVILITVLSALTWLITDSFVTIEHPLFHNYMVFPLLIWAAFRFGPRGTGTALLFFAVIVLWNTVQGHGPLGFADQPLKEHLLSVQIFLFVATLSGFTLAAVVTERKQAEEALRESEQRFRGVIENTEAGYFFIDRDGLIQEANTAWLEMYGYSSPDEIVGKHFTTIQKPDDIEKAKEFVDGIMKGVTEYMAGEFSRKCEDGSIGYHTFSARPVTRAGEVIGIEGFIIDTTDRRSMEDALRDSENSLEKAQAIAHVGSWTWEVVPDEIYWSDETYRLFGWEPGEEVNYDRYINAVLPEDRDFVTKEVKDALDGIKPYENEHHVVCNGEVRVHHTKGEVFRDEQGKPIRMVGVVQDITDTKMAENEIKESLKEKEVLLREIHHRVKNNFQIVSSLLDMIKMRTDNQEAIDLLTDARSKIYTMALVHTQLYEEERFDQIDMEKHIRQLVNHLSQVYSGRGKSVSPTIQHGDVHLTVNQAIPCALVLNELVSNAFKHAFRAGEQGTVEISIQNSDHDMVTIRVKDDGVGIPEQLDIDKTQTLGLKLTKNLVESQLKGEIQVNRDSGTEVIIKFKAAEQEVQHGKHA